jgi:hypothetical protein
VDPRDVKALDYSTDVLIQTVDEAASKAGSFDEFYRMVESSVDQVLQQLDSNQWTSLTQHGMNQLTPDLNRAERLKLIELARLYYLKDPLIHQAASLITNYTFADGFRFSCNNESWMQELQDFWSDEDNQLELTSQQAQETKSVDLIVDGEIFFVLFKEPDGRVKVRTIPPEEITEVITHPDDYRRNLYYQRKYVQQGFNFTTGVFDALPGQIQEKTVYYADWRNYEVGGWGFEKDLKGVQSGSVYQIATNKIGRQKRGNTETYPALDWVKAHREMLQNWVTIVKAYATLAWKAKAKGGDDRDLTRIREKLQNFLPAYNAQTGQLAQPGGTAGVAIENDNLSLTPMKTAGMATDPADSRQVRLMAGAGLGIMEHYFGDAGNANLATAQAMELPMLKKFSARQRYWEDVFGNIFTFVIITAIEAGRIDGQIDQNTDVQGRLTSKRLVVEKDQAIVVQAPPILQKNIAEVGQGIVPLVQNELVPWEEAARYAMKAMDVENIEESLEVLRQEKIQNEQKAKQDALDAFNRQQQLATQRAQVVPGGPIPPKPKQVGPPSQDPKPPTPPPGPSDEG